MITKTAIETDIETDIETAIETDIETAIETDIEGKYHRHLTTTLQHVPCRCNERLH